MVRIMDTCLCLMTSRGTGCSCTALHADGGRHCEKSCECNCYCCEWRKVAFKIMADLESRLLTQENKEIHLKVRPPYRPILGLVLNSMIGFYVHHEHATNISDTDTFCSPLGPRCRVLLSVLYDELLPTCMSSTLLVHGVLSSTTQHMARISSHLNIIWRSVIRLMAVHPVAYRELWYRLTAILCADVQIIVPFISVLLDLPLITAAIEGLEPITLLIPPHLTAFRPLITMLLTPPVSVDVSPMAALLTSSKPPQSSAETWFKRSHSTLEDIAALDVDSDVNVSIMTMEPGSFLFPAPPYPSPWYCHGNAIGPFLSNVPLSRRVTECYAELPALLRHCLECSHYKLTSDTVTNGPYILALVCCLLSHWTASMPDVQYNTVCREYIAEHVNRLLTDTPFVFTLLLSTHLHPALNTLLSHPTVENYDVVTVLLELIGTACHKESHRKHIMAMVTSLEGLLWHLDKSASDVSSARDLGHRGPWGPESMYVYDMTLSCCSAADSKTLEVMCVVIQVLWKLAVRFPYVHERILNVMTKLSNSLHVSWTRNQSFGYMPRNMPLMEAKNRALQAVNLLRKPAIGLKLLEVMDTRYCTL